MVIGDLANINRAMFVIVMGLYSVLEIISCLFVCLFVYILAGF